MVEAIFRTMKSVLETRPIYHRCDQTIRGHVFCSFLALLLRKELQERLAAGGVEAEWADVLSDLDPLGVTTPKAGATTLELQPEGAWNPLNSVSLIDRKEGRTILMQGGRLSYPFKMESLKDEGRFLLAVNHVAVDKNDGVPGKQLRLLGNPVTSARIDLLVAHPTARPKRWELSSMNGAKVAEGSFQFTEGNVQYGLNTPGMRSAGVYVLRVELDNGEVETVQVMRK